MSAVVVVVVAVVVAFDGLKVGGMSGCKQCDEKGGQMKHQQRRRQEEPGRLRPAAMVTRGPM